MSFDMVIAVGGAMLITTTLAGFIADSVRIQGAQSLAARTAIIADASVKYMQENNADLLAMTGGGAVVGIPVAKRCSGCASPAAPGGLSSIQDDGFLPASFVDLNGANQSHALIVQQDASGKLDGIITTYAGDAIEDTDITFAVASLGAAGGGTYTNAAFGGGAEIIGSQGGWRDVVGNWAAVVDGVNVTPTSGTLQVSVGMAALSSNVDETKFLHRDVGGDPSLNQMNTAIDMNGQDINNADVLSTRRVTATELIRSTGGNVRGVNTIADSEVRAGTDVNATNDVNAGRHVNATSNLTAGGSATVSGNITGGNDINASRNISAGRNVNAGRNLTATDHVIAGQEVRGTRFVDTNNTGYYVDPRSTSRVHDITTRDVSSRNIGTTGALSVGSTIWASSSISTGAGITASGNIQSSSNVRANGRLVAPSWRDLDDNYYIVDPNQTSFFNEIFADQSEVIDSTIINLETTSITTNILTNLSDASLKKDVEDLDGLEIIRRLSSKKYRWKENDKAAMGFIAQQVQSEFMQDFPSLVHENPETGLLSVDYIAFIPALVDAVQQLEARIEELESK